MATDVTWESKVITTRKPHPCIWDGEVIPTGDRAYHYRGIWKGEFQNWYMHPECFDVHADTSDDGCILEYGHLRGSPEER